MTLDDLNPVLRLSEACRIARISVDTWKRRRPFPAFTLPGSNRRFVDRAALLSYLMSRTYQAPEPDPGGATRAFLRECLKAHRAKR